MWFELSKNTIFFMGALICTLLRPLEKYSEQVALAKWVFLTLAIFMSAYSIIQSLNQKKFRWACFGLMPGITYAACAACILNEGALGASD
jgi:TRAP-type uncharacterized transport system fused permease subunit